MALDHIFVGSANAFVAWPSPASSSCANGRSSRLAVVAASVASLTLKSTRRGPAGLPRRWRLARRSFSFHLRPTSALAPKCTAPEVSRSTSSTQHVVAVKDPQPDPTTSLTSSRLHRIRSERFGACPQRLHQGISGGLFPAYPGKTLHCVTLRHNPWSAPRGITAASPLDVHSMLGSCAPYPCTPQIIFMERGEGELVLDSPKCTCSTLSLNASCRNQQRIRSATDTSIHTPARKLAFK